MSRREGYVSTKETSWRHSRCRRSFPFPRRPHGVRVARSATHTLERSRPVELLHTLRHFRSRSLSYRPARVIGISPDAPGLEALALFWAGLSRTEEVARVNT